MHAVENFTVAYRLFRSAPGLAADRSPTVLRCPDPDRALEDARFCMSPSIFSLYIDSLSMFPSSNDPSFTGLLFDASRPF